MEQYCEATIPVIPGCVLQNQPLVNREQRSGYLTVPQILEEQLRNLKSNANNIEKNRDGCNRGRHEAPKICTVQKILRNPPMREKAGRFRVSPSAAISSFKYKSTYDLESFIGSIGYIMGRQ